VRRRAIPLALALACTCAASEAQTVSARIEGIVTDVSGAVVPDARIDVVETDTSRSWVTTSSAAGGGYAVPALPPGRFAWRSGAPASRFT
jgi:hypothetical protein